MTSPEENDLLARIVLQQEFCTPAQIEKCLRIQIDTNEGLSLGQSLKREGYLSDGQYSRVLKLMRSAGALPAPAEKRGPLTPQQQEDDLLGKLAVRGGWVTAAELRQCLGGEAADLPPRTLSEILVAREYLDPAEAKELLARLTRRSMRCGACNIPFSILSIAQSPSVDCPRCGGRLEESKAAEGVAVDIFATRTFSKEISAAIQRPPGGIPRSRGRRPPR
jgi:hypothetical protein